jgi:nucleoside-diphosphate-sugar epimerase
MLLAMTGATGRVGRRLLPRLLARGDDVKVLVRSTEAAAHVASLGAHPVIGDLRDEHAAKNLVEATAAVLHLAAVFTEADAADVNMTATRALADAAAAHGAGRFVFTSTNLVYPGGLGRPATEDDPLAPEPAWGAYARTKAAADEALRARTDLESVVVRLAFVYGEGDPHLRESLRWASHWPGHRRLQLVHHADVAQALTRTLDAPGIGGRVYNVGDLAPVTAVELHQVLGATPAPRDRAETDGPAKQDESWHAIVDTRRIRRELGFQPYFPSVWTAYDRGAL